MDLILINFHNVHNSTSDNIKFNMTIACGLRTYGVPACFISLLEDLHSGIQAIVQLGGHLGCNFPISNGVQ
jgi:hypothetical protein